MKPFHKMTREELEKIRALAEWYIVKLNQRIELNAQKKGKK